MSESKEEKKWREAAGVPPITIITPQFERESGAPKPADGDGVQFSMLRVASKSDLEKLGMRPWNDPSEPGDEFGGKQLMLFPGEWYSSIPSGFEVVNIFNKRKVFVPGQTNDDIRYGCLSFGILVDP